MKQRCTKELIATDCMEYCVTCCKGTHAYIGLTCGCGECQPQVENTNNLSTCPFCGEPLVEISEDYDYESFVRRN